MRRLAPLGLALGTLGSIALPGAAEAQHKGAAPHHAAAPQHHAAAPQQHHAAAPQHRDAVGSHLAPPANYGSSGFRAPSPMNFPPNTMNFPSNAITFPNGVMNFPSNGIATYGSINNIGSGSYPALTGGSYQSNGISAAMLGMPVGIGGVYHGITNHHRYSHHSRYNGSRYALRGYRSNQSTLTTAQKHYFAVVNDLEYLGPHTIVSGNDQNKFHRDVAAMATGVRASNGPSLSILTNRLADAMVRRKSPTINTAQIAQGLRAAVYPASSDTPAQAEAAIHQAQVALRQGGVPAGEVQEIGAEMQAYFRSHRPAGAVRAGLR